MHRLGFQPLTPHRSRLGRSRALLLGVVIGLGLTACRPDPNSFGLTSNGSLRGRIFVLVGMSPDERFDSLSRKHAEMRLAIVLDDFRRIHPLVRAQVQTLPETELNEVLLRRNRAGLSPDVVIVKGGTAIALQQKNLIRPLTDPSSLHAHLDQGSLQRLRLGDGRLVGLPIGLFPQLACYNRQRLSTPPTTLQELLAPHPNPIRIGLPMELSGLAWTLGSLGASKSVLAIASGQPPTPEIRQPLAAWLAWLRSPELQQRTLFKATQVELVDEMVAGGLDWIPCRGSDLFRLRNRLGPALAVATLPAGPGGRASAITIERVIALGMNSSPNQSRIAKALIDFSINPVSQRSLALRSEEELSVLTDLNFAKTKSPALAAMLAANVQSDVDRRLAVVIDNADRRVNGDLQSALSRYLFDEIDSATATDSLINYLRPLSR